MTERIPFLLLVHHRIIESQVINIYIINWLSYFIHTFIFPKKINLTVFIKLSSDLPVQV